MELKKNMTLVARVACVGLALVTVPEVCLAKGPNCSSPEGYPASIAYVSLKNDGILTPENTNFKKTKVKLLASEEIRHGIYRQVHYIAFTKNNGTQVSVIDVTEASSKECSWADGDIFLLKKIYKCQGDGCIGK